MKILFCNIAWMDYYKGNIDGDDVPHNGGSYVVKNGKANEEYNFEFIPLEETSGYPEGDYCLGFVETKSTNGVVSNQLNIEKIAGCEDLKGATEAEDVLVVFCALYPYAEKSETYVVGWYKHATVYRYYEQMIFAGEGEDGYVQSYNIIAKKENCVLLPTGARRRATLWKVNRSKNSSYGLGQSNVWFAQDDKQNPALTEFLQRIEKQVNEYRGENWIDKYPAGRNS